MSDHDETLCEFFEHGTIDEMRKRVKDPKWICKGCGRAANKKEYLCEPVDL
ncbi:MAG: hypothetical protein ACW98Y_03810 [Candidatus Thorarchaeota archaeon]|jgi:hypothetical protein